jgi:hypothetical protein
VHNTVANAAAMDTSKRLHTADRIMSGDTLHAWDMHAGNHGPGLDPNSRQQTLM